MGTIYWRNFCWSSHTEITQKIAEDFSKSNEADGIDHWTYVELTKVLMILKRVAEVCGTLFSGSTANNFSISSVPGSQSRPTGEETVYNSYWRRCLLVLEIPGGRANYVLLNSNWFWNNLNKNISDGLEDAHASTRPIIFHWSGVANLSAMLNGENIMYSPAKNNEVRIFLSIYRHTKKKKVKLYHCRETHVNIVNASLSWIWNPSACPVHPPWPGRLSLQVYNKDNLSDLQEIHSIQYLTR